MNTLRVFFQQAENLRVRFCGSEFAGCGFSVGKRNLGVQRSPFEYFFHQAENLRVRFYVSEFAG
jgi:hypothetical protein